MVTLIRMRDLCKTKSFQDSAIITMKKPFSLLNAWARGVQHNSAMKQSSSVIIVVLYLVRAANRNTYWSSHSRCVSAFCIIMSTFWYITDADKQVGIGLKENKSRLKPAPGLLSNQLSINIASHGYERLSAFGEKLWWSAL